MSAPKRIYQVSAIGAVIAAIAVGWLLRSRSANSSLQPGRCRRCSVLMITIDTLRMDRVGAYAGGPLTPALDAVAARGIRFSNAHAHVPLTLPAHTSILTGLIPPSHGVRTNGIAALRSGTPTLASLLHEAGYRTGAFVGAFVLDARFGLDAGFDIYDDRVGSDIGPVTFAFAERPADRVVRAAGDWILGSDRQPFFAWVHLFDPHAPYRAPERRATDPYDNEVAFADAQIGRLIDRLRAAGRLDSTLIVALADHGESLGEHGEATHGLFAYEATLRIPLIVAGPGLQPAVIDASASQADVMPTVLDLLGLSSPRVDGRSLLAAVRGERESAPVVYFEALDAFLTRNWAPLTGVIVDGWKYIELPDSELYHLAHDATEKSNEIGREHDRATALRQRLTEWPSPAVSASVGRPVPLEADAAERLRSLGYTAARAPDAGRMRYTASDDPKHLVDVDRRYERALTLTGDRKYSEAAALLRAVVAERPDFVAAYLNLASVYIADGEPQQAVALIEDAARRGVKSLELQARLGAAYLEAGGAVHAAEVLEPIAAERTPGNPVSIEAANTLAVALTKLGRFDRARQLFTDVLARSPRTATTWTNLGLLELESHHAAAAARAFERAVDADPRLAQAWQGLAAARTSFDPLGAVDAWRRALELNPRDYDVLFNIAVTLREQGRGADARPYIERFVREAPPSRYARDIATFREYLSR